MHAEQWAAVITAIVGIISIVTVYIWSRVSKTPGVDWSLRVFIVSTIALVLSVVVPAIASALA